MHWAVPLMSSQYVPVGHSVTAQDDPPPFGTHCGPRGVSSQVVPSMHSTLAQVIGGTPLSIGTHLAPLGVSSHTVPTRHSTAAQLTGGSGSTGTQLASPRTTLQVALG
jgi:hypothetical protein